MSCDLCRTLFDALRDQAMKYMMDTDDLAKKLKLKFSLVAIAVKVRQQKPLHITQAFYFVDLPRNSYHES